MNLIYAGQGGGMEIYMECIETMYPLGYVFIPNQDFDEVYDMDTALERGTLFPELDLPLGVYGKEGDCENV